MIDAENLRRGAAKWEVELDATALSRFDAYAALLLEWNQKINLTAIKAPDEIVAKHFIDSLALLSFFSPAQDAKVIDVGTGAGFPGLALLIARPDLQLTLLDSTKKKLLFLEQVLSSLDLRAETLHQRAEEAGQDPLHREQFDLVTARAVSNLRDLSEYCLPFAKLGGFLLRLNRGISMESSRRQNLQLPFWEVTWSGWSVMKSIQRAAAAYQSFKKYRILRQNIRALPLKLPKSRWDKGEKTVFRLFLHDQKNWTFFLLPDKLVL